MGTGSGGYSRLLREIKDILSSAGYTVRTGVVVGRGPGGTEFKAKLIGQYGSRLPFLVSCHTQSDSGSTEHKIPFDVIAHATVLDEGGGRFSGAFIVLEGEGWARKDYYVGGGLNSYLKNTENVRIVTLEWFREQALSRNL